MAESPEHSSAPSGPQTGVVLAAGFGSRLAGTQAATDLKPLTPVAGVPLLFRTLGSLVQAGCERAVVVLGYKPEEIRAATRARYDGPLSITFVRNERFGRSNGLSVLAAREAVGEQPFLLTMADHILSGALMNRTRAATPPPGGATLMVDRQLGRVFDMDDATKVQLDGEGRVDAIGKTLDTYDAVDTGVFVCTPGLMDALDAVRDETGDAALSDGIRRLAEAGKMHALDIEGAFWQDVDTPSMLAHAEEWLDI
jgi:choline kinase